MRENFYAEYTKVDGQPRWLAYYRHQDSRLLKCVNDFNGLVYFNSEAAARDAASKAHTESYAEGFVAY